MAAAEEARNQKFKEGQPPGDARTPPPPPRYSTRVSNDANVEDPNAAEEEVAVKHVKVPASLFVEADGEEFEEADEQVDSTTQPTVKATSSTSAATTTRAQTNGTVTSVDFTSSPSFLAKKQINSLIF